ncbi:MAG TPA: N-acetyl-gamma-glutamyl-phosphate reductase [Syntrophothermus lipocalidus]|nr:N-acetyl-gamma-glutamyl-phosphate reductase [Syntrophothermus lipocalidus]
MVPVGIIGDGYTAAELVRILSRHRGACIKTVFSTENIGRKLNEVYPHLSGFTEVLCQKADMNRLKSECRAVFLALPHGLSVPIVRELTEDGVRCIDLGADFRLKDPRVYEEFYELTHEAPELLESAVYGLPELYRAEIRETMIVANPGCFPTGAILALAPLLKEGLIETDNIVIDSKTGVSGAGRSLKLASHFCEVNEGVKAYSVGNHRHAPEIAQELSLAAGQEVDIVFTPHLIPMSRGILTTAYFRIKPGVTEQQVKQAFDRSYSGEHFVRVLPEGTYPHTRWVYGSNFADIGIFVDEKKSRGIVISAIDNLNKGASGQAVQNFNIMFGFEETEALDFAGIFP